ncbi:hypothetical protein PINS_up000975 [Pythium insidiosum]|nr:hypothetical protein PINS_up000975 [Pythium insidiosum]
MQRWSAMRSVEQDPADSVDEPAAVNEELHALNVGEQPTIAATATMNVGAEQVSSSHLDVTSVSLETPEKEEPPVAAVAQNNDLELRAEDVEISCAIATSDSAVPTEPGMPDKIVTDTAQVPVVVETEELRVVAPASSPLSQSTPVPISIPPVPAAVISPAPKTSDRVDPTAASFQSSDGSRCPNADTKCTPDREEGEAIHDGALQDENSQAAANRCGTRRSRASHDDIQLTESEIQRLERRKRRQTKWDVGDPRRGGQMPPAQGVMPAPYPSPHAPFQYSSFYQPRFPRGRPAWRHSHSFDDKPFHHPALPPSHAFVPPLPPHPPLPPAPRPFHNGGRWGLRHSSSLPLERARSGGGGGGGRSHSRFHPASHAAYR